MEKHRYGGVFTVIARRDDEEALKWAALEKLPTFDRLRKGLLFGSKGANEVDVQSLGFQDKRNLVERLVNTVEEDNEKFLLKLRNRIDRVGIDIPTIEVRYEHLNVDAEAYTASRALPTFVNFNINLIEGILNFLHVLPSRKKPFTILKDTSGRITYNGHGMEEFVPQRTAAYISQHDLHIGEMTVRETLAYSARFQGVGSRYEMLAELSRREKAANIKPDPDVDMYMKLENGTKLGVLVMESRGFFPQAYWYWIGVGGLFGFVWLFNIFYLLSLTYLKPFEKPQAVLPEETEDDAQKGGSIRRVSAQVNGSTRRSISSGSSSTRVDAIEANGNTKRGMILPFEPHSLTFDDVRYSVDMPAEMKAQGATEDKLELLKGVSGAFRPGVLTALMGVSGAGKTTLMDVLAGRKTGGYIEGNITISGYPKNQATFARISGYCEQNDIHSPNVTVYESLVYSAWLRLPREVDAETRKMFIEEVMELVELTPLRGALVGLPGVNGLSTEQRKRLTIAVELVANPSIIFMDEPTSGLMQELAIAVLFLMKRGGEEIYVGPLGHNSSHLIKYFEGIEGVPKIKDGYNPATWMLEVTTSAQELVLGVDFADQYKGSELYTRNKALIKELSIPRPGTKDLFFPTQYSQSFLTQCIACLWKQHWSYWRNPPYTAVRFLFTTVIALIFGTMFWDLGSKWNTRQDLFNAMGSMYAAINFLGFQYGSTVQPVVAIERTVFYRERAAGMYSALPYAFSQFLIEIPYVFIQSIVYGLIVYSMMGFDWNAEKFFWFIYFLFFSLLYFVLYGMMTVAVTPNHNVATIISSFFYAIWNLFSGFVVPRPRIPVWWRWYYWATPVAYTLYGIIVSQFGEIKDQMEGGDETVEEFLRSYFGFRHDMLGMVAAILLGFVVLFTFIFAYSIRTFNFQRR
ncbi:UNVERIFIED_CONTAM: Pleiotropic drug resistance protein 1 [Sesamum radiatum]|uniref:Pleiotropic drug resistance protein 1 n=1 Tax=Sesamum radiatum TaxID=300843 RepID=A0AAW2JUL8_SESRA